MTTQGQLVAVVGAALKHKTDVRCQVRERGGRRHRYWVASCSCGWEEMVPWHPGDRSSFEIMLEAPSIHLRTVFAPLLGVAP